MAEVTTTHKGRSLAAATEEAADRGTKSTTEVDDVSDYLLVEFLLASRPVLRLEDEF